MSKIPDQYKGTGYGTVYGDSEIRQAIANAEVAKSLGSSPGDASADNQDVQIAIETTIRDTTYEVRDNTAAALKEGADILGATMPAGGASGRGWLSAIWKLVSDIIDTLRERLPSALVGGRFQVDGSGVTQPVSSAALTSVDGKIPSNLTVTSGRLLVDTGGGGGGGTSDSTAANQTTQIAIETAIRDKLPSALVSDRLKSEVLGNVAAGVADTGNPIKMGGKYNAIPPTLTDGQRGDLQLSARSLLLFETIDFTSSPANITAADVGSSTVSGQNSQGIITGTPTANSTVAVAGSGNTSFSVLVTGTWVGTLQFERSLDNGTTWTSTGAFSAGTSFSGQTITSNGAFHGNASSATNIRMRATTWSSGTATIRILLGKGTGAITIGNPIRLYDQVNNAQATIKPASTVATAADTAIVVAVRDAITAAYNQFAAETILTAPTTTSNLDVTLYRRITCQFTVASINTSVDVRLEGSCDTVFFNLSPTNTDTNITANGTYAFILESIALHRIRFRFVTETGGTAATIAVRFVGG
ncbi:hypothetical protein [aff. Roholtiella sp. LEGE 12411]|uniref:hypothetical protein n=1 Tax=aff. Roholtiella sp. LEGE 12411 TaxID=1828822 RepID=UPI0018819C5C|nr:hypothetical protein [aff. Roholtiella sp. LEGE 12411]MBE9038331.1 hypothetical protein [aff. Roholtiella sp. LEGE 12411]